MLSHSSARFLGSWATGSCAHTASAMVFDAKAFYRAAVDGENPEVPTAEMLRARERLRCVCWVRRRVP